MDKNQRTLFAAARIAGMNGFRNTASAQERHEWLCAEVMFAWSVGDRNVALPKEPPSEPHQMDVWKQIAESLCTRREERFSAVYSGHAA